MTEVQESGERYPKSAVLGRFKALKQENAAIYYRRGGPGRQEKKTNHASYVCEWPVIMTSLSFPSNGVHPSPSHLLIRKLHVFARQALKVENTGRTLF
jgi:hypothetical protein